jgi:hypothetical protein
MMDDHRRTAPVRIAADWIKIFVFIAILPLVFVVSVINWLMTGEPIMSADEILLTKILLAILSPFITTIFYVLHKHWRLTKDPEYRNPDPCSSGVHHHARAHARIREVQFSVRVGLLPLSPRARTTESRSPTLGLNCPVGQSL